jgi:hypothetical protein
MRLLIILVALAALIGSPAAAAECMQANQDGEIAEGNLSQGTFEDAAGRPEQAFILTLPVPTCLTGSDEMDNVEEAETIHIYSFDEAALEGIKRLVGQDVHVRGTPFSAHTAHHHAPIVMEISQIDPL